MPKIKSFHSNKIKPEIADYITKKQAHKNHPFRIKNGEGYYLVDNKEIPQKEWEATNPKPEYIKYCENNPDKTHIN